MKGVSRATIVLILLMTLLSAQSARAIVIEDIVSNHPLVSLVNTWSQPLSAPATATPPSTDAASVTAPEVPVAPDNMTVEVIPVGLPPIPPAMVFVIYLVGALVFYTLLVLVAQPSPAEY